MLQQFLNDLQSGAAPQACSDPNNIVWKRIAAFEQTNGKSMTDSYTRQEYLSLFSSMNIRSASYFNKLRSAVKAYVSYLVDKKMLSSDHLHTIAQIRFTEIGLQTGTTSKTIYFHSLAELDHAILDTLAKSESYDETRYDMAVCALYLAWFGFDRHEITELLKTDVSDTGVLRRGRLVPMPASVCSVIQRYCASEGYSQRAKGIIFHKYQPSSYLFRSTRLAQITDYSQLTSAINRFKTVSKGTYPLEYDVVRKSGILNRVCMLELEGKLKPLSELQNDLDLASAVFETSLLSPAQVSDWFDDYTLYKAAIADA